MNNITTRQLTNDIIRDLIVDIRFSKRRIACGYNVEEETIYLEKCYSQLRKVLSHKHSIIFDRNGWPTCLRPN